MFGQVSPRSLAPPDLSQNFWGSPMVRSRAPPGLSQMSQSLESFDYLNADPSKTMFGQENFENTEQERLGAVVFGTEQDPVVVGEGGKKSPKLCGENEQVITCGVWEWNSSWTECIVLSREGGL